MLSCQHAKPDTFTGEESPEGVGSRAASVYGPGPGRSGGRRRGEAFIRSSSRHAGVCHRIKQALNLRCTAGEGAAPELVAGILDQLDEGDQQAPRMRSIDYQPLQKHSCYLLLHHLLHSPSQHSPLVSSLDDGSDRRSCTLSLGSGG